MKLRVLIADPNREFQQMMTALLSRERDMEAADVSSDGLETLAKIKTLHPDVVLLDLVQPRLDGLGVLQRLASQESAPPVLVLTGFVNSHVIAECASLGAAYFMPKPCDTAELIQRLRKYAQMRNIPPAGQVKAVRAEEKYMNYPLESAVTDKTSRESGKNGGLIPRSNTECRPETFSPTARTHSESAKM